MRACSAGSELNRLTPENGGDWLTTSCGVDGRIQWNLPPPSGKPRIPVITLTRARQPSLPAGPTLPIGMALMNAPPPSPSITLPSRHLLGIEGMTADGDRRSPRPRRRGGGSQPPDREEEGGLARPHPDQPLLRSLHPHPVLLRARRQAARRRRDEHGGRQLLGEEGRDADRHRDDAERHAARHPGRPPSRRRRGGAARAQGDLLGDQRRRRRSRASDPGAARRPHHPPPQGRHRKTGGRHLRRHRPQPRGALQHPPPQCAWRHRACRRAVDAVCRPASSGWASRYSPTCALASPAPTSS